MGTNIEDLINDINTNKLSNERKIQWWINY